MLVSASWPLRLSQIAGAIIAATIGPFLWSVTHYPITLGTIYTGPITLYMAVSVASWILTSLTGLGVLLWVHYRCPALRRRAWFALLAGELFFVAGFFVAGALIERELEGGLSFDAPSVIILLGAAIGCAWGVRETLRAPRHNDRSERGD